MNCCAESCLWCQEIYGMRRGQFNSPTVVLSDVKKWGRTVSNRWVSMSSWGCAPSTRSLALLRYMGGWDRPQGSNIHFWFECRHSVGARDSRGYPAAFMLCAKRRDERMRLKEAIGELKPRRDGFNSYTHNDGECRLRRPQRFGPDHIGAHSRRPAACLWRIERPTCMPREDFIVVSVGAHACMTI